MKLSATVNNTGHRHPMRSPMHITNLGRSALLSTISGRVLSKSEAATLTADCVEDALLTMLDERTQRELREVE